MYSMYSVLRSVVMDFSGLEILCVLEAPVRKESHQKGKDKEVVEISFTHDEALAAVTKAAQVLDIANKEIYVHVLANRDANRQGISGHFQAATLWAPESCEVNIIFTERTLRARLWHNALHEMSHVWLMNHRWMVDHWYRLLRESSHAKLFRHFRDDFEEQEEWIADHLSLLVRRITEGKEVP